MKKKIFILLFLVSSIVFSQEKHEKLKKQFRIAGDNAGIEASYEFPIAKEFTLDIGTGIGFGYYVHDNNSAELKSSLYYNHFPPLRFKSKLKYIYNREKRAKKGKNNVNNSGNYIALQTLFVTKQDVAISSGDTPSPNSTLLTEVHWGMQRSLGGNWLFNVYFGLGYIKDFDTDLVNLYSSIGVEFSYILF